MKIEAKLRDNNSTITNPNPPKHTDSRFFFFDFDYVPRVGESVLLHGNPGGLFIVCAVVHEIREKKSHPILILEKYNEQTRQEILKEYGWEPGDTNSMNEFEHEQHWIDN